MMAEFSNIFNWFNTRRKHISKSNTSKMWTESTWTWIFIIQCLRWSVNMCCLTTTMNYIHHGLFLSQSILRAWLLSSVTLGSNVDNGYP